MFIQTDILASNITPSAKIDKDKEEEFSTLFKAQTAKDTLLEITKDGMRSMWEWQIKELKQRIASQVMEEKGITKESLAAMPPEQKEAIMQAIMDEVQKRLEVAMAEAAKKNGEEGKNELGSTAKFVVPPRTGPDKNYVHLTNSVDFQTNNELINLS